MASQSTYRGPIRTGTVLLLVVLALGVFAGAASASTAESPSTAGSSAELTGGDATVEIQPVKESRNYAGPPEIDQLTRLRVELTGFEGAVSSYDINIEVNNTRAQIVDYRFADNNRLDIQDNTSISADNQSIRFSGTPSGLKYDLLGFITIRGEESGPVTVEPGAARIGTRFGSLNDLSTAGYTSTVIDQRPPAAVSVRPVEDTVAVGNETTAQVAITGTEEPISGYIVSVAVNNTAASIVDYELAGEGPVGPLDATTISADNSSITLKGVVLNATLEPEEIVANITLAVNESGPVEVMPTEAEFIDTNDTAYNASLSGSVIDGVEQRPEAAVDVRTVEDTASVGSETTAEVVVTGASNGVSAYDIDIDLNSTGASIVDYELTTPWPGFTDEALDRSEISADNSSIALDAALRSMTYTPAEEIVVAKLTLAVNEPGVAEIAATDAVLSGVESTAYDTSLGSGSTLAGVASTPETGVDVRPTESEVSVGSETTAEVVVTGASNGVSAYEVDIGLNNTAASIVDYELTAQGESGPLDNSTISADGSSIALDAALLDAAYGPAEEVVVAELTLAVEERGAVAVTPAEASIIGTESREYDLALTGGVVEGVGLPPIVGDDPPTDPDDDGLYEDTRGDNDVDVLDVQTLFNHLDAGVVQDNARAYDFSSADATDEVTILDVQALFDELGSDNGAPPEVTSDELTVNATKGSIASCGSIDDPGMKYTVEATLTVTLDDPSDSFESLDVNFTGEATPAPFETSQINLSDKTVDSAPDNTITVSSSDSGCVFPVPTLIPDTGTAEVNYTVNPGGSSGTLSGSDNFTLE